MASKVLAGPDSFDSDEIENETLINKQEQDDLGDITDGIPGLMPPSVKMNDTNHEAFLR